MAEEFIPVASTRTSRAGKVKASRVTVSQEGMIEGIIFDEDKPTMTVEIPFNVLLKKLRAGRFMSTLFNLRVDGQEDVRVICRNVKRDIAKDLPTHIELMRLRRTSRINLFIPVEFVGEDICPGLIGGGVLTVVRPEVELQVTAGDIPEKIVVDLSTADVGDVITIEAVKLPEGTKPTIDRNFVIANISAPSGLSAEPSREKSHPEGNDGQADEEGEAVSFAHLDGMIADLDEVISDSSELIKRMKKSIEEQTNK